MSPAGRFAHRDVPRKHEKIQRDLLSDRIETAVKALQLAGARVSVDVVLKAAGADLHRDRETLRGYVRYLAGRP